MRSSVNNLAGVVATLLIFAALAPVFAHRPRPIAKSPRKTVQIPTGLSESHWRQRIPSDNPMSQAKVALGRTLFFDRRLSADGNVSCATCHDPARAFTDGKPVAIGVMAKQGTRNTPTILNAAFAESLFWDGRARSLEEQVSHPLMSSFEMGMGNRHELVARVFSVVEYRRRFRHVFKSEGIDLDTIAKAIAAYERTLLSGNSPFDRFVTGNVTAISDSQRRGWELFNGKAKCIVCHTYSTNRPLFTDFEFHNTGVAAGDTLFDALLKQIYNSPETPPTKLAHSAGLSELGRFTITLKQNDVGAFRTPTLRDVELTSPYMHDGSLKTLIDVVQFYNRGGVANSYLDSRMHPLGLTAAEVNDLVEFLRALTSDNVLRECQTTRPQKRTPTSKAAKPSSTSTDGS
jgi:cytochrome c peroxidase